MAKETHSAGKRRGTASNAELVLKERQALELRTAGVTYTVIAERLGYSNESGAYKAVQRALTSTLQEPADELRTLETQRLDRMLAAVWEDATEGDVRAVDRVLRIIDQRAKLLGLNTTPNSDLGLPAVDEWIRGLMGAGKAGE